MEVIDRLVHAVRPENYPADCHQNKGQKDLPEFLDGRKCPVRSDDVFIFTIVRSKNQRQEQKRMESAPYDKSVLPLKVLSEGEPIKAENYRQECREYQGIERH